MESWQRMDERIYTELRGESNHRENAPLNRSHPFLKLNDICKKPIRKSHIIVDTFAEHAQK